MTTKLVLQEDQILGWYMLVPENESEDIRKRLLEEKIYFSLDQERASRLKQPGTMVFLFHDDQPERIRDTLSDQGFQIKIDRDAIAKNCSYLPPVSRLLTLGETRIGDLDTRDYLALGITSNDVPELIRMALDKELHSTGTNTSSVYAPAHAWRALAQLKATEAITPLLNLWRRIDENEDDWVSSELPRVFARLDPAQLRPWQNISPMYNTSFGHESAQPTPLGKSDRNTRKSVVNV